MKTKRKQGNTRGNNRDYTRELGERVRCAPVKGGKVLGAEDIKQWGKGGRRSESVKQE